MAVFSLQSYQESSKDRYMYKAHYRKNRPKLPKMYLTVIVLKLVLKGQTIKIQIRPLPKKPPIVLTHNIVTTPPPAILIIIYTNPHSLIMHNPCFAIIKYDELIPALEPASDLKIEPTGIARSVDIMV